MTFSQQKPSLYPVKSRTRTISITSGKGGVGKTTLTTNMALNFAEQGKKVLILDGDLGMGNVDIMFGIRTTGTINDVLNGDATLEEVLVDVAPGVTIIPGGSGIFELQTLTDIKKRVLLDQVSALPRAFDYLLVDTSPGIDEKVLYLNSAAHEICVVVTPDPSSITDAYALIKVLNKYHREDRFSIICNQVRDEMEGLAIFRRLSDVATKFLVVGLDYLGSVPHDPVLNRATKSQQLVLRSQPRAISSNAIRGLGKNLSGFRDVEAFKGGMQFFFEQLIGVA